MTTMHMKLKRFVTPLSYPVLALALMNAVPTHALAQEQHQHANVQNQETAQDQTTPNPNSLVEVVKQATARFQDVKAAMAAGYTLQFGCVTGGDSGAMGLHYINSALVSAGTLDPKNPQIVIYEPMPDGTLKLIGADFLVLADQWNASHTSAPEMMGQLFHYWEAPNRFGLPPFYTLHVWAWKNNPNGAFVNWHPKVQCKDYTPQK